MGSQNHDQFHPAAGLSVPAPFMAGPLENGDLLTDAQWTPEILDAVEIQSIHPDVIGSVMGVPLFHDEHRSRLWRESPQDLDPSEIGMRQVFATIVAREAAKVRALDREKTELTDADAFDADEFNASWRPSPDQRDALRAANDGLIRIIGRQTAIINNVERSIDQPKGLRPDQLELRQNILRHLLAPPNLQDVIVGDNPIKEIAKAISVVAPTGSGKTPLEAVFTDDGGIGRPVSELDPEPLRAAVTQPTIAIGNQFLGKRGNDTFGRFTSQEVVTTGRFGGVYDETGNALIVTNNQTRSGGVDLSGRDVVIVDEGHHILGPMMREKFVSGSLGPLVVLCTATPQRADGRHLGDIVPYNVQGESILWHINKDLLNGSQIFTIRMEADAKLVAAAEGKRAVRALIEEKITEHVVELAAGLAQTGRRIAIFGRSGAHSKQARTIVDRLRALVVEKDLVATLPDGTTQPISAEALGDFNTRTENAAILDKLDKREVNVVATTKMIGEGLDAPIDVVIDAWAIESELLKEQHYGRGARKSEEYPVTVYIEFIPAYPGATRRVASHWGVLGLETVRQGMIIAPEITDADKLPSDAVKRRSLSYEDLPLSVQALVRQIDNKPVREVTIPRPGFEYEEPPEGSISLDIIMRSPGVPEHVSETYVMKQLESAGIGYKGIWVFNADSDSHVMVPFFDPEAASYFEDNPIPAVAEVGELRYSEILDRYDIDSSFLMEVFVRNGIIPAENRRIWQRVHSWNTYDLKALTLVEEAVANIPNASESDIPMTEFIYELGASKNFVKAFHENGLSDDAPDYKRFIDPVTGRPAYAYFLNRQQADMLWIAFNQGAANGVPLVSLERLQRFSGVAIQDLRAAMTEDETAQVGYKWPHDKRFQMQGQAVVVESVAADILQRTMLDKLPPQLVTLELMDRVVRGPRSAWDAILAEYAPEDLQLVYGDKSPCYTWDVVRRLQEAHGVKPGAPEISFYALPQDNYDGDFDRIDYAIKLQRRFLRSSVRLVSPSELKAASRQSRKSRTEGVEALAVIDTAKETLDALDIGLRLGLPADSVNGAIAKTAGAGYLPPVKQLNSAGLMTPHYSGRQLEEIIISLSGISPAMMADQLNVPQQAITKFMFNRFEVNNLGRYSNDAWRAARSAFNVPRGARTLGDIAGQVGEDAGKLAEFIRQNGGAVHPHWNSSGEELDYLYPDSVQLAQAQTNGNYDIAPNPSVSELLVNREEVAQLSGIPAEDFDGWLLGRPEFVLAAVWYRCRTDHGKVLPHFRYTKIKSYISDAKRRAK